jgi:UDP-N-acetylmuramoylalanine-D-glutamate ligase
MEYSGKKTIFKTETKLSADQVILRNREYTRRLKRQNRFESVEKLFNHNFINDCNSTDINGCMATIDQLEGSIIWINYAPRLARNYSEIIPLIESKVRAVFSFGPETGFVYWAAEGHVELFVKTESLTEALILANLYAKDNENIVFAPAAEYDGTTKVDWVEEFKDAMTKLTDKTY